MFRTEPVCLALASLATGPDSVPGAMLCRAVMCCVVMCCALVQTLEFPVLAKQWRAQPKELDVVAAGVAVWRERITKLSGLVRQGAVTAEVGGFGSKSAAWHPAADDGATDIFAPSTAAARTVPTASLTTAARLGMHAPARVCCRSSTPPLSVAARQPLMPSRACSPPA